MNDNDLLNQITERLENDLQLGPSPKSAAILDIKPFDWNTDLAEVETLVRGVRMDGLYWGGSRVEKIGYSIKKLKITCILEDMKVQVEYLIDKLTQAFPDHIQSIDCSFNMDLTIYSLLYK